ncbi:class I adenylate-forming enzyme family protein [Pseudonocardia sulfidoxydans]|nr:AMP-binding protein [Pseudonocardia sulfidoxydans]
MISFVEMLELPRRRPGAGAAFMTPGGPARELDELWTDVHRLADALVGKGFRAGHRAAVLATDSYEYMVVILACMRVGIVYVPLNYRLAAAELDTILAHARPELIFVGDRYAPVVERSQAGQDAATVALDPDGRGRLQFRDLVESGRDRPHEHRTSDEDVVAVCYTSGTTGRPKGVMQSQRAMKTEIWRQSQFPGSPGDVRYSASPMFHVAGHRTIFTHLARGFTSVLLPQFDAVALADLVRATALDGAFLVPTMLDLLLDELGPGTFRLPQLHYGGSTISPRLLSRAIEHLDAEMFNLFGSSETGLVTVLDAADHRAAHAGRHELLGSLGRAAPGADVRILDPDGEEVQEGEVGEIVCRTDGALSGYLEQPEATAEVLRDGWVWTGDLARRDAEGYHYYMGRSRDLIIRGGENVYPQEIESVLSAVPGVTDVAVLGVPDERWGESVVAVLECRGEPPSADDVRRLCQERLASFKVPGEFVFVADLPRTAAGKIATYRLRDQLGRRS